MAVVKTDRQVDQAEEVLEGQETLEDTLHQKETEVVYSQALVDKLVVVEPIKLDQMDNLLAVAKGQVVQVEQDQLLPLQVRQ
ncbi:MAG: hypothetical protein CME38_13790 [Haliea sp.]|nr:hypothetical protein [Haliea sp.]